MSCFLEPPLVWERTLELFAGAQVGHLRYKEALIVEGPIDHWQHRAGTGESHVHPFRCSR